MNQARESRSSLQWNAGGWLGAQVGGTLWMLILGCVLMFQGEGAGSALLAAGIAGNLVGAWLWSRRHRMRLHFATQMLFAACGAFAVLALLVLARWGAPGVLQEWRLSPALLLVYPAVMLLVFSLDRGRALEARSREDGNHGAEAER